ncbi:MAG: tRNA (N6-threonylcarbamoyladenosine(37)-N6)-methyltransferase TrmO [Acetobacteraceae bacterium]|nr:tRNA (N6-threonylcarbamoyladenosine(37)-N6)-methyltransferase TrmO [Acetobacteraceae bacterium]
MHLRPIGILQTPFRTIAECPRNTRQLNPAPLCRAIIAPEFTDGLTSLEGFSHLILLYWLHEAAPATLKFKPPFDTKERGVFATRAPRRPNQIGLAVVACDGFENSSTLKIRHLDCLDGTPLLDIKPYLSTIDAEPDATMGWLAQYATR